MPLSTLGTYIGLNKKDSVMTLRKESPLLSQPFLYALVTVTGILVAAGGAVGADDGAQAGKTESGDTAAHNDSRDNASKEERGTLPWNDRFKSWWTRVMFSHTRNNVAYTDDVPLTQSRLTIGATVKILDAKTIVGISRDPVLLSVRDEENNDQRALFPDEYQSEREKVSFGNLNYGHEYDHLQRTLVKVIRPLNFNLAFDEFAQVPDVLKRIEGYLPALVAKRQEEVDIPFVPADGWTEIIPGRRIRLSQATWDDRSYRYTVEQHPDDSSHRGGLYIRVSPDTPLPDKIVLKRQLVNAKGKVITESRLRGIGGLAGSSSGSGSMMQKTEKISKLRFVLGSDLQVQRVPFTLTDIELPTTGPASTLMNIARSDARDLSPVMRVERELLRKLKECRRRSERYDWTDAKDKRIRDAWKAFTRAHERGIAGKPEPVAIDGVLPDVSDYGDYLGVYRIEGPDTDGEHTVTVRKDDEGRFLVDLPEGTLPAVARDGVVVFVFDDIMIRPSDHLDPKSSPTLYTITIARLKGTMVMIMKRRVITRRYTLVRVDKP